MGVNVYKGRRYAPVFDGDWDAGKSYEELVYVLNSGNSYISKRAVPKGTPLEDREYWLPGALFNAQVAKLEYELGGVSEKTKRQALTFDSAEDMAAYGKLKNGDVCHTLGRWVAGDHGDGWYTVNKTAGAALEAESCIEVGKGLYAHLLLEDRVTPLHFGAKPNDSKIDSTEAIRHALHRVNMKQQYLYFPPDSTFYVSGPLNVSRGTATNLFARIVGPSNGNGSPSNNKQNIRIAAGASLFKDGTHRLRIENMVITGYRQKDCKVFDTCSLSGTVIDRCYIADVEAMFYDTGLSGVCDICNNRFLSVVYFAKIANVDCGLTDSRIHDNYINGGAEGSENSCFMWSGYNGSNIYNNFIDYYKRVFNPYALSTRNCQGCPVVNNQIQVFKYLISAPTWNTEMPGQISSIDCFTFIGNTYNWTDRTTPTTKSKFDLWGEDYLSAYPDTPIPESIFLVSDTINIKHIGEVLQSHISKECVALFYNGTSQYDFAQIKIDINTPTKQPIKFINNSSQSNSPNKWYIGKYSNEYDCNILTVVDSLPNVVEGWSTQYPGRKVIFNGNMYTLKKKTIDNQPVFKWIDEFGEEYKPETGA